MGGNVPALARRLKDADERRQELARTLQALGDGPLLERIDCRRLEAQARLLLADWRGLLARNVAEGRAVPRQLIQGPPKVRVRLS